MKKTKLEAAIERQLARMRVIAEPDEAQLEEIEGLEDALARLLSSGEQTRIDAGRAWITIAAMHDGEEAVWDAWRGEADARAHLLLEPGGRVHAIAAATESNFTFLRAGS